MTTANAPKAVVAEIAAKVLRDIETHGHFQDPGVEKETYYHKDVRPNGPCCLVVNPTMEEYGGLAISNTSAREYQRVLEKVLPIDPVEWNDSHTEDEVKEVLRILATGEYPEVKPTKEEINVYGLDAGDDGDIEVDD